MTRLLALFVELCLLRRGPQDLPYSPRLTRGLLWLAVGADLLALQLFGDDPNALARSVFSLALLLGLPWLLLHWRGQPARYAQTLAAFLGSGLLFTVAMLPLLLAVEALPPPVPDATPGSHVALRVALFVLLGWKLAINGHVWRHALDWPRAAGLPFAIALFIAEVALVRRFFPAPEIAA